MRRRRPRRRIFLASAATQTAGEDARATGARRGLALRFLIFAQVNLPCRNCPLLANVLRFCSQKVIFHTRIPPETSLFVTRV